MQGRIKGPTLDLQDVRGSLPDELPDELTDPMTVLRPPSQCLKDEHVEGALKEFDPTFFRALSHYCRRHSSKEWLNCLLEGLLQARRGQRFFRPITAGELSRGRTAKPMLTVSAMKRACR